MVTCHEINGPPLQVVLPDRPFPLKLVPHSHRRSPLHERWSMRNTCIQSPPKRLKVERRGDRLWGGSSVAWQTQGHIGESSMHVEEIHYNSYYAHRWWGIISFDRRITAWLANSCTYILKASVGMYSGCDFPYKSCLCTDFFYPAIPTSPFDFIVFYTCFCSFFIPL